MTFTDALKRPPPSASARGAAFWHRENAAVLQGKRAPSELHRGARGLAFKAATLDRSVTPPLLMVASLPETSTASRGGRCGCPLVVQAARGQWRTLPAGASLDEAKRALAKLRAERRARPGPHPALQRCWRPDELPGIPRGVVAANQACSETSLRVWEMAIYACGLRGIGRKALCSAERN
jgi:hypothetical protein